MAGCGGSEGDPAPTPEAGSPTATSSGDAPATVDASAPNIILLSIDTLRPDHLGSYGYSRDTSPNIDRLAAEGGLFEDVVSTTSWTLPAHAALFTGLPDSVHGCYDTDRVISESLETMAERLQSAGYETGGFFSGPYLHPAFGMGQGFETYIDCSSFAALSQQVANATGSVRSARLENASHRDITSPRVYEESSKWLKQQAASDDAPFFLFAHLWDVHFDFIPPEPYDTMFDPDYEGTVTGENFYHNEDIHPGMAQRDLEHVIALYDGEIAWTDMWIGKLLDDLDQLGLADDTVVIVTADHGTEFFEHGGKLHRHTLYEEVIRIPLIIRAPGRVDAGTRWDTPAVITDLLPTIMEIAGLPVPTDVMGRSLVPVFDGREPAEPRFSVSELITLGMNTRSVRHPDRKIITSADGTVERFDLTADPTEQSPLAESHELAAQLDEDRAVAEAWLAEHIDLAPDQADAPEIPEAVRRQLTSLGYIGEDEGDAENATDDLSSTADEDPERLEVERRLGLAASLRDVGRLDAALSALDETVAAYPNSVRARLALAQTCLELGRAAKAKQALEEAIALDGESFAAHLTYADLMLRAGRVEPAVVSFTRATEIDPTSARAFDGLGNALLRAQKIDEAISAFEQVGTLDPQNANAWCNVGILHNLSNRPAEAIPALERAIAIDPGHAKAREELAKARAVSGG